MVYMCIPKLKLNKLEKLIEDFTVVDVEVNGFASSHGYTKVMKKLNRKRVKVLLNG